MIEDERIAALFASPERDPDEAFVARIERAVRAEQKRAGGAADRLGGALRSNARRARRSSPLSIWCGGWRPAEAAAGSSSRVAPAAAAADRSFSLSGSRSSCARRRQGAEEKCQRVCKPGSVHRLAEAACAAIPLGDGSLRPSSNQPGRRAEHAHMPPLFGLAPGGVCRAAAVTGSAVGSYPTLSLSPGRSPSDLLSVALSLGSPPPAVTRHRRSMEPGLSSPRLRGPRPPDPLASAYIVRSALAVQEQLEQDRAALAVDRAVDQLRAEAALEGDHRGERVADVVAAALEREQEAAVGPVRIDQVPGRPRQWRGRAGRAAPSRTARPDPACAPARRRNGRRHWRARYCSARTMSASSGSSASICCSGNGPVAEFVAGIDDLDADAGGVHVADAAPVGLAGMPGALVLGDHAQHLAVLGDQIMGRRPRASGSRSRAIAEAASSMPV